MNKKPGCLGYIGDPQLYGDDWIPINKPVYWKVGIVFFRVSHICFFLGGGYLMLKTNPGPLNEYGFSNLQNRVVYGLCMYIASIFFVYLRTFR